MPYSLQSYIKIKVEEMKTIFVKPAEVERKWYVIDAKNATLGKVAVKAAQLLRGKHKPCYTPHQEVGDYVIIINAVEANLSANKKKDKIYYEHSGFMGGLKAYNYETLLERRPTGPMEKAVRGMLSSGALANQLFRNLKVYAGETHPHVAQQPIAVEV
jgi:large subunit ribosomal protein L13